MWDQRSSILDQSQSFASRLCHNWCFRNSCPQPYWPSSNKGFFYFLMQSQKSSCYKLINPNPMTSPLFIQNCGCSPFFNCDWFQLSSPINQLFPNILFNNMSSIKLLLCFNPNLEQIWFVTLCFSQNFYRASLTIQHFQQF